MGDVLDQALIPLMLVPLEFHVELELEVPDLLGLYVKLVGGQDVVPFELGPLPFVLIVVPANQEGWVILGLGKGFIVAVFLEGIKFCHIHLNVLLELVPNVCLLLFVLLLSLSQDLFDGFFILVEDQSENVPLADVFEGLQTHVREGVFAFAGHESPLLNHQFIPNQLVLLEIAHSFLDGELCYQFVHLHGLFLADSVSPIHGLDVVLGVPVDVVDDDPVGSDQVDAESSCPGREHEELILIAVVEGVHELVSLLQLSGPIEAAVSDASEFAVLFQDVQEHGELRKQQSFMAFVQQFFEELVDDLELAAVLDAMLPEFLLFLRPDAREEVGVQAYLPGDHLVAVGVGGRAIDAAVPEVVFIQLKLHRGERHVESPLDLGRQPQLEVLLGPPLEVGLDYPMKVFGHLDPKLQSLLFRALEGLDCFLDFRKKLRIREDLWHDEVEEGPEFPQVVAERGAREEQLESGLQVAEGLETLPLGILDLVSLVDDQGFPLDARKRVDRTLDSLVGADQHVELPRLHDLLQELFPVILGVGEDLRLGVGEPLVDFPDPI